MKIFYNTVVVIFLLAANANATDQASSGITIIGDQELPQVLYIVPWQPVTMPPVDVPKTSSLALQLQIPCQSGKISLKTGQKKPGLWPCSRHDISTLTLDK